MAPTMRRKAIMNTIRIAISFDLLLRLCFILGCHLTVKKILLSMLHRRVNITLEDLVSVRMDVNDSHKLTSNPGVSRSQIQTLKLIKLMASVDEFVDVLIFHTISIKEL
jgi:hypothetical protein